MAAQEKAKMFLFAYTVKDYEKTAAFYKEALGVEFPEGTAAVSRLDIEKVQLSEGDPQVELLQLQENLLLLNKEQNLQLSQKKQVQKLVQKLAEIWVVQIWAETWKVVFLQIWPVETCAWEEWANKKKKN